MKKLGYVAVAGVLAASVALAGCSGNAASSASSSASESASASSAEAASSSSVGTQAVAGGWEFSPLDEVNLEADFQKIFDAAVKGTDAEKDVPVAVIATQLVSGMNYAFLCEADNSWHVVTVYNDLQNNASLTSDVPIDVANVKVSDTSGNDEEMMGAWEPVMPEAPGTISEASFIAFDEAMKGYTGLDLVPFATLGTQVVSGTNYRYLCAGQTVSQDASTSLYVVDVYQDLDGKSKITNVAYFDLLAYIGS